MKFTHYKFDGIDTWTVIYRDLNVGDYHLVSLKGIGIRDMIVRSSAIGQRHEVNMEELLSSLNNK